MTSFIEKKNVLILVSGISSNPAGFGMKSAVEIWKLGYQHALPVQHAFCKMKVKSKSEGLLVPEVPLFW